MEVLGALAREPVERLEVLHREPVEVAAGAHEAAVEELLHDHPAGALDVHAAATREMPELLAHACRTREVGAVVTDRALVLDHRGATHRAARRHHELALRAGASLEDGPHHLRDDVAGLPEHDVVADADVLASHLVEVVERGPRHRRARHLDRCHVGDRRERPGPAHVGHDVLDLRSGPPRAGTCRRWPSGAPG